MPIKRIRKPIDIEESKWFEMMNRIMKKKDSTILKEYDNFKLIQKKTNLELEKRAKKRAKLFNSNQQKKLRDSIKKAFKKKTR